jgi:hypothetical protein
VNAAAITVMFAQAIPDDTTSNNTPIKVELYRSPIPLAEYTRQISSTSTR